MILIPVDSGVLLLILSLVIFEAWFIYQGRPRTVRDPGDNHVHQGTEISRHEVSGRTIIVAQCRVCGGHFNFEAP